MALDSHAAAAAVLALATQHHVAPDPRLLLELATTHALRGELQAASAVLLAAMRDGSAAPHTGGGGGLPLGGDPPLTPLPPMPRRGVPLGLLEAQRALLTRFIAEGGVEGGAGGGVQGGGLGPGPHAGVVARGSHRSDIVSMLRGCSDTVSRPAHAADARNAFNNS